MGVWFDCREPREGDMGALIARLLVVVVPASAGGPVRAWSTTAGSPQGDAKPTWIQALNFLKNRNAAPGWADFDPAATLAAILAPGDDTALWDFAKAVTVTGYVIDVHPGGIETANCHASAVADRDTHIEIALASTRGVHRAHDRRGHLALAGQNGSDRCRLEHSDAQARAPRPLGHIHRLDAVQCRAQGPSGEHRTRRGVGLARDGPGDSPDYLDCLRGAAGTRAGDSRKRRVGPGTRLRGQWSMSTNPGRTMRGLRARPVYLSARWAQLSGGGSP